TKSVAISTANSSAPSVRARPGSGLVSATTMNTGVSRMRTIEMMFGTLATLAGVSPRRQTRPRHGLMIPMDAGYRVDAGCRASARPTGRGRCGAPGSVAAGERPGVLVVVAVGLDDLEPRAV